MPEIRQNFATKEWVIIATERAKRPEQFKNEKIKRNLPDFDPKCPFCPGNEKDTPGETFRISNGKEWVVRVFPNKFAALSLEGKRSRKIKGIIRCANGVGIHEIIAESPLHNTTIALQKNEEVEMILKAYRTRYRELINDLRIELIIIFKNHGEAAGTSLEHSHSQLIGLPIVPTQVRGRLEEAMRYYDDVGECAYCKMIREEKEAIERIVFETEHFVAFVPYAAFSPFHTWIIPKRHMSAFGDTTDSELKDMAVMLKTMLAKFYYALDNPDFNFVIRSAPTRGGTPEYFHWYLSIVPRLTKTAGFELGSGMYINVSLPENDAKFLREIKIP